MNLFDQNNETPVIDENKDYLNEFVGEGKKYKDENALAKAYANADITIELFKKRMDEVNAENARLLEESRAQAKLQDLIDRLEKSPSAKNDDLDTDENDQKPVFDPRQIEDLVSKKIQETEAQKKAQSNYNTVESKLKERFGNNYSNILKERANELGLSLEDVNSLAMKSPTAFFNTMGLNESKQIDTFSPPASSRRSDNFGPTRNQKRTWSYYQEMKKTNPKMYFDPKIANQMIADMASLGDEFKDGDYNAI